MKPILDAAQTKALEQRAESLGRPPAVLMESAGSALAGEVLAAAPSASAEIVVVCGRGNNGGDGLVCARKLATVGRRVRVLIAGGPEGLKGEPLRQLDALKGVPCTVGPVDSKLTVEGDCVVVDAVFGTGLNRAPEGKLAEAIQLIQALRLKGAVVVAADLPSGVQSDSAAIYDPAVTADVTVCFGALKVGACVEPGSGNAGSVVAVDIGLPEADSARAHWVEEEDVLSFIPKRVPGSHKGTFGHLLVIAGSRGKSGAAAMAGLAALRAGVGLVTVATPEDALDSVQGHAPELMGLPFRMSGEGLSVEQWGALEKDAKKMQALVVGPGIPRSSATPAFLEAMLRSVECPVLIDADGLNALAGRLELLKHARGPVVLTPHPGEMARLTGKKTAEVQSRRLELARAFAEEHQVVLVLKGSRTLVAGPDGTVHVNPTGNPGMATGGTGDILSGIIGALLAGGMDPLKAATAGVYVHGLAGDRRTRQRGQAGLIATDLLDGLGDVWAGWGR